MAGTVEREQAARATGDGDIVNGTSNSTFTAQATISALETELTNGSYVARVIFHNGVYVKVDWFLDGKPFTTYKSKGFDTAEAKQYLQTMIDIAAGTVAPTSVDVSPATATKAAAATQQLTATVTPAGANQEVTWATSDATKATVSSTGLVTAVATGSATITATTKSGPIATDTSVITIS